MSSLQLKASPAEYSQAARYAWAKPKFARIEAGEPGAADSDGTVVR